MFRTTNIDVVNYYLLAKFNFELTGSVIEQRSSRLNL